MKMFLMMLTMVLHTAISAQGNKQVLEGNGNLVKREIKPASFDVLNASGIYELKLVQGNTESVTIEADDNLQELFQVSNNGSSLVINMKKLEGRNLRTKNKMQVVVTFKNLKSMQLKTIGNVVSDQELRFNDLEIKNRSVGNISLQLVAGKLSIDNSSVGNTKISGKADDAQIKNNGVGSLEAGNLMVQTIYIENEGVGNAEVHAVQSLKVKDSFLGKVKNKGSAQARRMNKVRV
jgi:hypothetical protein